LPLLPLPKDINFSILIVIFHAKLAKKILITKFFTIFVPKYRKKIEILRFENHDKEVDVRFMHSCGMHDRKYIQPSAGPRCLREVHIPKG
jgi:hypothetical protein